ncbi:OmpA family protein [Azospirillum halopraeferens]|uniref:OmpA family protein n=1 Tax=Azospirillum halopraeferens TaxID=34010 RepID=UPI0003F5406B|nr:OmpA family protein [Azospirillum halopraeferens]
MPQRTTATAALLAAALATGLAGCQTGGQQGGIGNTGGGAVLGALGGAAVGALTGRDAVERRQRALIGAGIGALAGGAVGYYMDNQEQQLRRELAGTPVAVERQQETIVLTVPSGVTFAHDSAALMPQAQQSLDEVARVLTANPQTTIDIIGYTDSTGNAAYNQRLSEQRATAVANHLISRGVQPARILAVGQGINNPVASNATAEGRAMNRRVEIRVNPYRQPMA